MGADKALLLVDGTALARRVADGLSAGGADPVVAIGGDLAALVALGLTAVPDLHPGEGPLGGILTALAYATERGATTLLVAACDHPDLDGATVGTLLAGLAGAPDDVVVAHARDAQGTIPLLLALRVGPALTAATARFAAGRRSVRALLEAVPAVVVANLDGPPLADADRPTDLRGR